MKFYQLNDRMGGALGIVSSKYNQSDEITGAWKEFYHVQGNFDIDEFVDFYNNNYIGNIQRVFLEEIY